MWAFGLIDEDEVDTFHELSPSEQSRRNRQLRFKVHPDKVTLTLYLG